MVVDGYSRMSFFLCRCYSKPYHGDFADWEVFAATSPLLPCAVLGARIWHGDLPVAFRSRTS